MERTIPRTATEEIDLYLRTIYSLLRSTTEIHIRTIEEVHAEWDLYCILMPEIIIRICQLLFTAF